MAYVEFVVKGLKSVRHVAAQIPKRLPENAFLPTLLRVARLGEDAMRDYLMRHLGEKATGRLVHSIHGLVIPGGEGKWKVSVGTNLEYALYRARGVPQLVNFNRRVQVQPGKWRWIGTKPAMQPLPFLDYTAGVMERGLLSIFSDQVGLIAKMVDEEQRAMAHEEGPI